MSEHPTESVLINFVYCHPVGHAVEAVQHCLGYRRADPARRIGVVLKANTAVDLAHWSPFVDEVYTVDFDVFGPAPESLDHIPRDWDWVVDDPRGRQQWQRDIFPGLAGYYDLAAEHFRARKGHRVVGAPAPSYQAGHRLELELPSSAQAWAAETVPTGVEPTIAVLPAGSAERWMYPSLESWRTMLGALVEQYPRARFCFVGKLTDDGRTSTGFSREEFEALAETVPTALWAVDVPLAEQLAAVQRCDLLFSPHSGFAFAAMAVGTPWLTLAGNKWAEYYFNPGVPFYSVLPDIDRYPCYVMLGNDPEPVEDDGPRSPSMSAARIKDDLAEIVSGARWLLEGPADFDGAMTDHFARIVDMYRGRTDLIFSVDQLHRAYLPQTTE